MRLGTAAVLLGAALVVEAAPAGDALTQACRTAPPAAAVVPAAELTTKPPSVDVEVLRHAGLRVVRRGDYLLAYTDQVAHDDAVALTQPDYGAVRSVQVDRTGALVAIGDQVSYRVQVGRVNGIARFTVVQPFPTLFAQRCLPWSQWFGACQPAQAVFSHALRAGLIEGFDRWGVAHSVAVGLVPGAVATPMKAPRGGFPLYRYDVPGSGALFVTRRPSANLYFDGERMHECPR